MRIFSISFTDCFEGYQNKPQHPMYTTTAMVYGAKKPSVHTMPTSFHCKSQSFSEVSKGEIFHLEGKFGKFFPGGICRGNLDVEGKCACYCAQSHMKNCGKFGALHRE